jgi:chaperonin GroES
MFQPLKDNVVVRLDENIPSAAKFGLILPPKTDAWRAKDGAVEGENRGTVVRVGPGRRSEESGEFMGMSVNVGEIVRFSELEYPTEIIDGQKYVLISEQDILWVEEPEGVN